MNIPTELKYTESNEWIKLEGKTGTIGISDYAQDQLSDIVFAEVLVNEGDSIKKGDAIATNESVKAADDVINSDPYGAAWIVKIELQDTAEIDPLLDSTGYEKIIQEQQQ